MIIIYFLFKNHALFFSLSLQLSNRTYSSFKLDEETHYHLVHEGNKAPEGLHLVLHHKEERREKVAHPLDITCAHTQTHTTT